MIKLDENYLEIYKYEREDENPREHL